MLKDMRNEAADKLMRVCQEAEDAFEEWLSALGEADLKAHFRTLAEVRDHLRCAREKTRSICRAS